jgi:hypothetical protein
VVQVKSETTPWIFDDQESVAWLIRYPTPLFLACVDKKQGSVSVYHVRPRFYLWALGNSPDRLVLTPEEREDGEFVQWQNGQTFSLPREGTVMSTEVFGLGFDCVPSFSSGGGANGRGFSQGRANASQRVTLTGSLAVCMLFRKTKASKFRAPLGKWMQRHYESIQKGLYRSEKMGSCIL